MISRRVLVVLATLTLALPIVILVLLAAGQLLSAMRDTSGATVLGWLAFAVGLAWFIGLVALVVVLALDRLGPPPPKPPHGRPDELLE